MNAATLERQLSSPSLRDNVVTENATSDDLTDAMNLGPPTLPTHGEIPRITNKEDRSMGSRQYLMPPQPNIQESYATMARQRNVSSMQITRENGANDRDGGMNNQLPHGARVKESWYRSRISIPAPHLESRNELDEEYLPRGGGFIRHGISVHDGGRRLRHQQNRVRIQRNRHLPPCHRVAFGQILEI